MGLLVDSFWNAPSVFWDLLRVFKNQRTLGNGFAKPMGPDATQIIDVMLPCQGYKRERTTVGWDLRTQHTITWKSPICVLVDGIATTLKPGSCNLYMFPRVTWKQPRAAQKNDWFCAVDAAFEATKKSSEILEGSELAVLKAIFIAIAKDPREREVLQLPDSSGANSILGMLVANTTAALELCTELFTIWPELMAQAHLPGPFMGENTLHVLAVNRQEDTLCDLLHLAVDRLERELLKDCLLSQALGPFFWGKPMNTYGGTPVAYAASFCMRRAVGIYLSISSHDKIRGFIDLNERQHQCKLTGFSPIHAVVANGHESMYDFVADLPGLGTLVGGESLRAREDVTNSHGILDDCAAEYGVGLNPLQLACQLGEHGMFKHILARSSRDKILWKWGPVTQHRYPLGWIDSATGNGGEVMELIGRFDAKESTQDMLRDEFMEGFIHEIFMEKWNHFGKHMWFVHRSLDVAYLCPLVANALWLKEDPEHALAARWLPALTLLMMMPSLEEDLRSGYLWLRCGEGRSKFLLTYCSAHGITLKLLGMGSTAIGCFALMLGYCPANISDFQVRYHDQDVPGHWSAAALDASRAYVFPPPPSPMPPPPMMPNAPRRPPAAAPSPEIEGLLTDSDAPTDNFPSWVFLATGLVIQMQYFFTNLTMPSQEVGILFIMISRMLGGDVMKFLKVFVIILINYGFAMYIAYPHTGDIFQPGLSPAFNSLSSALQALVEMAVLGENIALNFASFSFNTMGPAQQIESVGYVVLLYMYIIMALILLLNLLIAMMGDTYAVVLGDAVRAWRVGNAQMILRLEILCKPFIDVRSGEPFGDDFFFLNRVIDTISESGDDDGVNIDVTAGQREWAALRIQRAYRMRMKSRIVSTRDLELPQAVGLPPPGTHDVRPAGA
eukprot:CAMPEP_0115884524 /NCGR_PEP_ID=MMETSP0287-20121206/30166_1 /TAXON_ID=412157 /ORGANISM="Chrysochromulina rotalis, Strain UIO044" /LENGTH=897 /DNA_ID=CAMNT_0003340839 /DNA_START=17 /DNA_END=2710 /DNA_ORIENTATION=+